MTRTIRVTVPATTANLGSGFDCLGMALALHNVVEVREAEVFSLEVYGEGAGSLSQGRDNLVAQAIDRVFERVGKPAPTYALTLKSSIPLARGLGSSAAAATAGLLAGNALCSYPFSCDEILDVASALEGHPDNVAAAIHGGCVVAVDDGGRIVHAKVPVPERLVAVLFIPELTISTQAARAVLPCQVSRTDAVFNLGRAALLVASLFGGQLKNLSVATQDRLHQAARQKVFPEMPKLFDAALSAGALGAFLSGAGSTILALAEDHAPEVAAALMEAARLANLSGRTMVVPPSQRGALVEELE